MGSPGKMQVWAEKGEQRGSMDPAGGGRNVKEKEGAWRAWEEHGGVRDLGLGVDLGSTENKSGLPRFGPHVEALDWCFPSVDRLQSGLLGFF